MKAITIFFILFILFLFASFVSINKKNVVLKNENETLQTINNIFVDNGVSCEIERLQAIEYGWYIKSCNPLEVYSIQEAQESGLL